MGSAPARGGKKAGVEFLTGTVSRSRFSPATLTGLATICVPDVAFGHRHAMGGKYFANSRSMARLLRRRLAFAMMIVASQGPPLALAKISKKTIPSDTIPRPPDRR
jgi:hypothetical protein